MLRIESNCDESNAALVVRDRLHQRKCLVTTLDEFHLPFGSEVFQYSVQSIQYIALIVKRSMRFMPREPDLVRWWCLYKLIG